MSIRDRLLHSRRWLLLPVLLAALWLGWRWEAGARPVDLHVVLGRRSVQVRLLGLRYRNPASETVEHDTTLRFPSGAPPDLYQRVRLRAGRYDIGVRVVEEGGAERFFTRSVEVADRPLELNLE
jgi:hypothetical protein